jgi:hypothetical protein
VNESGHFGDDEALSALLDGALSREEAEALRRRLATEPALAARFEELRRVDEAVRGAYAGVAEEPVPRRIVDLVREGAPVVPLRRFAWPVAAAAGLAAGFLIAFLALRGGAPLGPPGLLADRGVVEKHSRLHAVLESLPSGETRELGKAWSATPRMTFRSREGLACRRVDLAGAGGSVDAVVCRRDGVWRAELLGYTAAQKAGGDGLYHPATGGAPSRVDDAINAMVQGSPLGRDDERDWMRRGWSDAPHQ